MCLRFHVIADVARATGEMRRTETDVGGARLKRRYDQKDGLPDFEFAQSCTRSDGDVMKLRQRDPFGRGVRRASLARIMVTWQDEIASWLEFM